MGLQNKVCIITDLIQTIVLETSAAVYIGRYRTQFSIRPPGSVSLSAMIRRRVAGSGNGTVYRY